MVLKMFYLVYKVYKVPSLPYKGTSLSHRLWCGSQLCWLIGLVWSFSLGNRSTLSVLDRSGLQAYFRLALHRKRLATVEKWILPASSYTTSNWQSFELSVNVQWVTEGQLGYSRGREEEEKYQKRGLRKQPEKSTQGAVFFFFPESTWKNRPLIGSTVLLLNFWKTTSLFILCVMCMCVCVHLEVRG